MARRSVVVLLTLLGAAFFISIVAFALLYALVGREPSVPANATLMLRIGGDLAEVAPADVVGYLRGAKTPTIRSLVDDLRKAKVDSRIRKVLLRPTGFDSPFWGKVQELRDAIIDFKKSGKPVYAYLEYGGDREYYLATAADKIFLMPSSPLDLTGVATYELFLRGTLDKVGAYPDLHHIGDYKTASNTFTEKGYTAAHKEMDLALNRDLYDQIVSGIASGRQKQEAEVRSLIDQGPFLPEDAVHAGLVDEDVIPGERELPSDGRIIEQLTEPSLGDRERVRAAAAEVVERERRVTEGGEPIGTSADVVVLAPAFVHQQHARSVATAVRRVHREIADHGEVEHLILDPLRVQHLLRIISVRRRAGPPVAVTKDATAAGALNGGRSPDHEHPW